MRPSISEVYVWVAHYADGTEGIEFNDGLRSHPALVHDSPDGAKSFLGHAARSIKSSSQHAPNRIVRIELRKFVWMSK